MVLVSFGNVLEHNKRPSANLGLGLEKLFF